MEDDPWIRSTGSFEVGDDGLGGRQRKRFARPGFVGRATRIQVIRLQQD